MAIGPGLHSCRVCRGCGVCRRVGRVVCGAMLGLLWSALCWAVSWLLSPPVLAVLVVTVAAVYRYLTRNFSYWPSRGVAGPPSVLPFGNGYRPADGKFSMIELDEWLHGSYCSGEPRFCGYLEIGRPVLFVPDLELIRAITIKDFEHFTDRRQLAISPFFRKMLSLLNGKEWKETRAVMSPSFSSSKLKAMHQLCLENADQLEKYMYEEMEAKSRIEIKDAFGRFTMDNIASCAFGIQCNSFEDPNTEFAKHAANILRPFDRIEGLRILSLMLFPEWVAKVFPDRRKPSGDFFERVVTTTIKHREGKEGVRKDYLQLLLETRDSDGHRILSDSSVVAQAVLFFVAGYDTTATLLTFAAFSLATSPDCQQKVHQEIDEVLARHDGRLTYEAVSELHYLDRVLAETLRLYPAAIRLERQCSKDYRLPGTEVVVPRGMIIQIPVFIIHRDPHNYPDPLRFDPDRFLPEQKEKRHPCAYLPFGSGPRNCIAMRFALFEAKVALTAVLRSGRLVPGPDTPPPPLPYDKAAFLLRPEGDTFLRLENRC